MSAIANLVDKLLDTVAEADLNDPGEDFVAVGLSIFALAVSKLPAAEREETLAAVENGALRQAVMAFPAAQSEAPSPPPELLQ